VSTPAGAISVLATLQLLDGDHAAFTEGVADGRYTFWLGSGISRGVVPGLDGVVQKVLEHLKARIDAGDPDGRFRNALTKVLKVARLTDEEDARLDTYLPVADWVDLKIVISRLTERYARMLKIRVDGEDLDYLLWEAVDVRETFAALRPPDAEHLCLAILGMEGVVPEIVSANWDGLVEAAFELLEGAAPPNLTVAVLGEDLREQRRRVRLLKFHGCAVLAKSDPATYRTALIARSPQVTNWSAASYSAPMRQEITNLATTTPTLMVGLSAQDTDIQAMFAHATATLQWKWPNSVPALVFAEDELGEDQLEILEVAYGQAYDEHRHAIEKEALVRAFAKPLLVALVLDVLARKARALIAAADASRLPPTDLDALAEGADALRDLAGGAAGTGTPDFVKELLGVVGRLVSLFQHGAEPPSPATYHPLTMIPVCQIATDPSLPTNGVRELAAALGLLGRGLAAHGWHVSHGPAATGTHGALHVTARHERALFFAATNASAITLARNGAVSSGAGDAVIVHSDDPAEPLPRSPSAPPGRTGATTVLEVGMGKLLREATSLDELERRFRLAVGLF
jgi:hypothetical protein